MSNKLHRFEGQDVIGTQIKITNAGDGLSKALAIEPRELTQRETVYVVLECEVDTISFKPMKDVAAVVRIQSLRAGTATLVDKDLVSDHLEAQRVRIEEAAGVHRLDFDVEEPDIEGDTP